MRVWVLETGLYEERMVRGVFAFPELAMAAWPRGVWRPDRYGWRNDLDWGDAAELLEFEVCGSVGGLMVDGPVGP